MFIQGNLGIAVELDKVNMPIGININAETPGETAINILTELIKVMLKLQRIKIIQYNLIYK